MAPNGRAPSALSVGIWLLKRLLHLQHVFVTLKIQSDGDGDNDSDRDGMAMGKETMGTETMATELAEAPVTAFAGCVYLRDTHANL